MRYDNFSSQTNAWQKLWKIHIQFQKYAFLKSQHGIFYVPILFSIQAAFIQKLSLLMHKLFK